MAKKPDFNQWAEIRSILQGLAREHSFAESTNRCQVPLKKDEQRDRIRQRGR
ncbi:MAG TPA: hypothetical protein VMR25_10405 [Planctomycetaceae bacterium]|nr:hypothetical protein [Planctomycetaceae bacterium]